MRSSAPAGMATTAMRMNAHADKLNGDLRNSARRSGKALPQPVPPTEVQSRGDGIFYAPKPWEQARKAIVCRRASSRSLSRCPFRGRPLHMLRRSPFSRAFGPERPVSVVCRLFGHDVARSLVQFDPHTFAAHSRCKRCGIALVRAKGGRWQEEEAPGA
jgi:hypothetical protein